MERAASKKNDYSVFMALANHIGHDKRGNTTYVRDENGNEVIETRIERQQEVHGGKTVHKQMEVRQKAIDDNTVEIAAAFRAWLAVERTTAAALASALVPPPVLALAVKASVIARGDRRLEAENYLSDGYVLRQRIESIPGGMS